VSGRCSATVYFEVAGIVPLIALFVGWTTAGADSDARGAGGGSMDPGAITPLRTAR